MGQVPMVEMDGVLLVSMQDGLLDHAIDQLHVDLADRMIETRARGLLIDISAVDVLDSFLARALHDLAGVARMMAAKTVLVGMRPAVAITLVDLGLTLPGLATALTVSEGMARIQADSAAGQGVS